jgi:hypothetical protein
MKMELTFYSPTGEPVVLTLPEARELYKLLAELFAEKAV